MFRLSAVGVLMLAASVLSVPATSAAEASAGGIAEARTVAVTQDFPAGFEGYHTYAEMVDLIQALAAAHPNLVSVGSIGLSYEGRQIPVVKISDHVTIDEDEPEILIDGLHHAREHLSAEQAIAIIEMLVDGYGSNERTHKLVDSREWWIVPMLNPDGGEWDIRNGSFHHWRKNRQPNGEGNPVGTDLNRNYGAFWGCCGGSSSSYGALDYRGAAPFSAPEAAAMRDFVRGRVIAGDQQIATHMTFHSTGEQVLWPWAHTYANRGEGMSRDEHGVFVALGNTMAALSGYTAKQGSDLYITDGDEVDWMFDRQGIFSFTIELYPAGGGADRYYPDDSLIERETSRNFEAVLYLARKSACPWKVIGEAGTYC
ncbi:MAG: M14 family metallopeptidase [Candidatus Limnocylindrales bacterium]